MKNEKSFPFVRDDGPRLHCGAGATVPQKTFMNGARARRRFMVTVAGLVAATAIPGAMAQERSIVVTAVSSFKLIETLAGDFDPKKYKEQIETTARPAIRFR